MHWHQNTNHPAAAFTTPWLIAACVAMHLPLLVPTQTQGADGEVAPKGVYRALLISAEQYECKPFDPLPNACAEIQNIKRHLKRLGYEDIVLVCDDAPERSHRPLKANIEREIESLANRAKPNDTILLLISAHGLSVRGQSYFCPLDHCLTRASIHRIRQTCVSVNRVYQLLEKCRAKHKLLVAEACRTTLGRAPSASARAFFESMYRVPPGTLLFCSCSAGESSFVCPGLTEAPEQKHSVFLHFFARGLEEADVAMGGNNGRLTVTELVNYVSDKTRKYVNDYVAEGEQNPQCIGNAPAFPIGEYENRNPYIDLRIPMDDQLELSLRRLALAGNDAARRIRERISDSYVESIYWMNRTTRSGGGGMPNVRVYADESVAHYARTHLLEIYRHEMLRVKERCFDPDIELRGAEMTHCYRADMYRNIGMYQEALDDYTAAGVDFQLFAFLNADLYGDPKEGQESIGTILDAISQADGETGEDGRQVDDHSTDDDILKPVPEEPAEEADKETATPDESDENGEGLRPEDEVCRLIVRQVIQWNDKPAWLRVTVCDMGVAFDSWIPANQTFWSPELAECYWISTGEKSQRYRNAYWAARANVTAILRAAAIYDTVAGFVNIAGAGLPAIGGYVNMGVNAAQEIVRRRIASRKSQVRQNVLDAHIATWWRQRADYLERTLLEQDEPSDPEEQEEPARD